jgi:FKBP-type peptidyl-prolyl cis-trans isomerase
MSSTRLRDRIFAGFGALLFLVTASAFTVMVIIDMTKKDDPLPLDTQTTAAKEETLPTPEVFKPEADVTELQSTDLTEGTGDAAKNGDTVVMKYYGTIASDGTVFDENYSKDKAYTLKLGNGEVIPGWDQGLLGMKAGGVRRLVIPSDLAYGEAGRGSIPANADLVFVVKLLRIQK